MGGMGQRRAGRRQEGGSQVKVSDALRHLRMFGPDDDSVFDPEDFADDIDTSTGTFDLGHWADGIDPSHPDLGNSDPDDDDDVDPLDLPDVDNGSDDPDSEPDDDVDDVEYGCVDCAARGAVCPYSDRLTYQR